MQEFGHKVKPLETNFATSSLSLYIWECNAIQIIPLIQITRYKDKIKQ